MFRLGLACVFFAVLSVYRFPDVNSWSLPVGAAVFVVAALSDALDGYLARRWNAISVFGRVMDPFADKVLVLGAFIVLAGPQFTDTDTRLHVSGVSPWMAVVILSRELLVTTLRGVFEARGVDFSATASGKLKMALQSAAVPLMLLIVLAAATTDLSGLVSGSLNGAATLLEVETAVRWNRILAWATLAVTIWSAVPYVARAVSRAGLLGDRPA